MPAKMRLAIPRWLKLWGRPAAPDLYPPDTPIRSVRYVVLDTEFSSREQRSNRLLSVGAITMEGARIRMGEQFYRVLNPGWRASKRAWRCCVRS